MEFDYMNTAQKRAQALKEDLTDLHVDHLDSFLDGVAEIEPPKYRYINGIIHPPFVKVKLKDNANVLDLGNVIYTKNDKIRVLHTKIIIENGEYVVHKLDPLPRNDGNVLSFPIQLFVTQDIWQLWKIQYHAIKERMSGINEDRAIKHHRISIPQPPLRTVNGQAPSKHIPAHIDETGKPTSNSKKRVFGEPVLQHVANKRNRMGFDAMSDTKKSELFDRIPTKLKVDAFNAIALAAYPGLDNVLMAAWNAVSVYEHIGIKFPSFHTSMTELKTVLKEFESIQYKRKEESSPDNDLESESTELLENEGASTSPRNQVQRLSRCSQSMNRQQGVQQCDPGATPAAIPSMISTQQLDLPHNDNMRNNAQQPTFSNLVSEESSELSYHGFEPRNGQNRATSIVKLNNENTLVHVSNDQRRLEQEYAMASENLKKLREQNARINKRSPRGQHTASGTPEDLKTLFVPEPRHTKVIHIEDDDAVNVQSSSDYSRELRLVKQQRYSGTPQMQGMGASLRERDKNPHNGHTMTPEVPITPVREAMKSLGGANYRTSPSRPTSPN